MPSDDLGGTIAQGIQKKDGDREWLTEDLYVPETTDQPLGELEEAFRLSREAYHVGQKIKDAVRDGRLPKKRPHQLLDEARDEGIITDEEYDLVRRADEAREQYIQVDSFELDEYRRSRMFPGKPTERGAFASAIVEGTEQSVPERDVTADDVGDGAPASHGDGAPSVSEAETDDAPDRTESGETA